MSENTIFVMKGTDKVISYVRQSGAWGVGDKVVFDMADSVCGKNLIHKEITTFTESGTTATLTIDGTDTDNLKVGRYVYNLISVDSNGKETPLIYPSPFEIGERVPTNG